MATALPIGAVLKKKYYITGILGEGATGFVYLCQEVENPGKEWAVKEVCNPGGEEGEEAEEQRAALERFKKEYEVLKRLEHPGLPAAVDLFSEQRGDYMVMEYVRGGSLQKKIYFTWPYMRLLS
jgi:serine/threonine-protein kinase